MILKQTVKQFKRAGGRVTHLPAQVALPPVLRVRGWEASELADRLREAILDVEPRAWSDVTPPRRS